MSNLYFPDENDPRNYLDQVDRGGDTELHTGQIYWCIDNAEHHFSDGEKTHNIIV